MTAQSQRGVGLHHLCLSSRSVFLCQGFRKYLPEVKKESALCSATQSREPRPRSRKRETTPATHRGHVAIALRRPSGSPQAQPHHVPRVTGDRVGCSLWAAHHV